MRILKSLGFLIAGWVVGGLAGMIPCLFHPESNLCGIWIVVTAPIGLIAGAVVAVWTSRKK